MNDTFQIMPVAPAKPVRKYSHPGEFEVALDSRITDPGRLRISFVVLLDGDLVMSPEHLGVAFMAAVLRQVGVTCEIREAIVENHDDALAGLAEFDPDLVCFTLMSLNVNSCRTFSERARTILPDTVLMCGGPAATFTEYELLEALPEIDFVATGEGESLILDISERLLLGERLELCPGLAYRDAQGCGRKNPARPLIHRLEALPFPARDQLRAHGDQLEYVRLSSSRGCVARCAFCSAPNLSNRAQDGRAWRAVGPERVVDEIEEIVNRHHFRTFDFVDSTFEDPDGGRVGKKRIGAIAQQIIDRGLEIYYNVCMRAENWSDDDHDLLALLARSGLEKVNIGIESGVPEELLLWEKRATVEDNIRAMRLLREHRIYLAMGFIPLHPYATIESILQNAEFLRSQKAAHNLRRLTERLEVYPGTTIAKRLHNEGMLGDGYYKNLELFDYDFKDPRVARLTKHLVSLYNNEDFHEKGVITNTSAVYEFEVANVVIETFISRLNRSYGEVPGVDEELSQFEGMLSATRQSMGDANVEFLHSVLGQVLNDNLDPSMRNRQIEEIEHRFASCLTKLRSEQLRLGMRLHRLGVDVRSIASTLPDSNTPGGAPRRYNGGAPTW